MANDVLRLKTDVLNELRNQKYYAQDELKQKVDDPSMSQREKVAAIIELAGEMVDVENRIGLVDAIFVDTTPQVQEPVQAEDAPTNIVEPAEEVAPVAELNPQGQTHSE